MINNTDKIELTKEQAMKILCVLGGSVPDKCFTKEQMDKMWGYIYESMEIIEEKTGIDLNNGYIDVDALEFTE